MTCPRCQDAALEERERDGVVIDVCRACRGVWLDRGELEKLIVRATRDFDELDPRRDELDPRRGDFAARRDDTPPRPAHYRDDDTPPRPVRYRDDDDDDRYRKDPRKKRRWYESLGDLFD